MPYIQFSAHDLIQLILLQKLLEQYTYESLTSGKEMLVDLLGVKNSHAI